MCLGLHRCVCRSVTAACRKIKYADAVVHNPIKQLLGKPGILYHGKLQGGAFELGVQVGVDDTTHALDDHLKATSGSGIATSMSTRGMPSCLPIGAKASNIKAGMLAAKMLACTERETSSLDMCKRTIRWLDKNRCQLAYGASL